jgi:hypothetical protein
MTAERRRWPRNRLNEGISVTLTTDGWSRPGRIADIGPGGAEVRLDGTLPCNLEVRIEHPAAGYLYATRAWAGAGVMGVAFDNPDHARAFLSLCGSRTVLLQSA